MTIPFEKHKAKMSSFDDLAFYAQQTVNALSFCACSRLPPVYAYALDHVLTRSSLLYMCVTASDIVRHCVCAQLLSRLQRGRATDHGW